nr:MAG TPA: hypothetical protein [Caudoviricetes sp.]
MCFFLLFFWGPLVNFSLFSFFTILFLLQSNFYLLFFR